jgi:hypothetical protein
MRQPVLQQLCVRDERLSASGLCRSLMRRDVHHSIGWAPGRRCIGMLKLQNNTLVEKMKPIASGLENDNKRMERLARLQVCNSHCNHGGLL